MPTVFGITESLPEAPEWRAARNRVIEAGRKDGSEHVVWTDEHGRLLGEVAGTSDKVVLPQVLQEKLSDPVSQIVLHHNHPSGAGLSFQDLAEFVARPGMASLAAHGHEGQSYVVSRTAMPIGSFEQEYWFLRRALERWVRERRLERDLSPHISHLTTAALAARGWFGYAARVDKRAARAIERHREAIEEILGPDQP